MSFDVFDKDGNRRDFNWLRDKFKVEFKDAGPGKKFKLVRVDEMEGPAVFIVQVRNEQGQPQVNQPIAFAWKQVDELDNAVDLTNSGVKSLWHTHALVQRTNDNGDTGFGFGGGSVIKENGGPHILWVLSPSLKSDALARVGWLGGTNHAGPNRMTFQIVDEPDEGGGGGGDASGDNTGNSGGDESSTGDVAQKLQAIHDDLRRLLNHFGLQ